MHNFQTIEMCAMNIKSKIYFQGSCRQGRDPALQHYLPPLDLSCASWSCVCAQRQCHRNPDQHRCHRTPSRSTGIVNFQTWSCSLYPVLHPSPVRRNSPRHVTKFIDQNRLFNIRLNHLFDSALLGGRWSQHTCSLHCAEQKGPLYLWAEFHHLRNCNSLLLE